jgi:hypothetical protein
VMMMMMMVVTNSLCTCIWVVQHGCCYLPPFNCLPQSSMFQICCRYCPCFKQDHCCSCPCESHVNDAQTHNCSTVVDCS